MKEKRKSCSLIIKSADTEKGIVTFYAASFGKKGADKDSDGDVILKGAFSKTIKENSRIKWFLNHNSWTVPGIVKSLEEDEKGLLVTAQLSRDPDTKEYTTLAKDTLIDYKSGVIAEHSIGYRPIKEDYDEEENANFIKEIKLAEVSSLYAWGANKDTPYVGMKGENDIEGMLKEVDRLVRKSDPSYEDIISLRKYSKRINNFLKSLEAQKKPVDTTLKELGADWYKTLNTNTFKL